MPRQSRTEKVAEHKRKKAKRHGYTIPLPARTQGKRAPRWLQQQRSSERFGEDTEDRAIEAFASGTTPDWFLKIRPSTEAEDQPGGYATGVAGVDLWVSTDRGEVAVQVKSSADRAAQFRAAHPDQEIAVVVLHRDMDDERIRSVVISAVERVWRGRVRRAA